MSASDRALQTFAAVTARDLQTRQANLSACLQQVDAACRGRCARELDEFLDLLVDARERMDALIVGLLALGAVSQGGSVDREVDLAAVVRDVMAEVADERGTLSAGPLPRHVPGCAAQMRMVVRELLANARRFAHPERPWAVRVDACEHPLGWEIRVADNGIGIAEATRERVFEMFGRLHGRGEYRGAGLGLPLCRQILRRHGGRIWVGDAPDGGTCVHLVVRSRAPWESSPADSADPALAPCDDVRSPDLESLAHLARHDLQEPLRTIGAFCRLVSDRYGDGLEPDLCARLASVPPECEQFGVLVRSRIDAASVAARLVPMGPVDLSCIGTQVVRIVGPEVRRDGGDVALEGLPVVLGDEEQLFSLVLLLCGQVIRAGTQPARLRLFGTERPDAWEVGVENRCAETPSAVLEARVQALRTLPPEQPPPVTDLELLHCHRIVERHGGRLWATSSPGRGGLCLCFTLGRGDGPGGRSSTAPSAG